MTNLEHLAQLEGDARDVAAEVVRRWPSAVITSSKRDVAAQAVAMAKNVARQRTWILGDAHAEPPIRATYRWSKAALLCHDWSMHNMDATTANLAAAFARLLGELPTSELVKLSRHLAPYTQGAHAFDLHPMLTTLGEQQAAAKTRDPELTPDGAEACAYLAGEAHSRGGTFLTREGEQTIWHWQAKD